MTEINLREIWLSQKIDAVQDAAELISKAKKMQSNMRIKIIPLNILLFTTICFIMAIVWYYQPKLITTKIGTLIVVIGIVMQIIASSKLIPLLKQTDSKTIASEYLRELIALKKKQAFLHTRIMTLYFVCLSVGIGLYMIEYAMMMTPLGAALSYGITALWIGFNWFYIRKRTIRKQQQKLNAIIEAFQKIDSQLSEEI